MPPITVQGPRPRMTPINCSLSLHENTHSVLSVVQLGCLKISVVRKHSAKFSAVRRPGWTSRGDSLHWGLTSKGCVGMNPALPPPPEGRDTHTHFGSCLLKLTQIHQCGTVKTVLFVWDSACKHKHTNLKKFLRGTFWNPEQIPLCFIYRSVRSVL